MSLNHIRRRCSTRSASTSEEDTTMNQEDFVNKQLAKRLSKIYGERRLAERFAEVKGWVAKLIVLAATGWLLAISYIINNMVK